MFSKMVSKMSLLTLLRIFEDAAQDALKLKTALYDPFPGDNSKMEKIVDEEGHNAGYATFVETMAKQAPADCITGNNNT